MPYVLYPSEAAAWDASRALHQLSRPSPLADPAGDRTRYSVPVSVADDGRVALYLPDDHVFLVHDLVRQALGAPETEQELAMYDRAVDVFGLAMTDPSAAVSHIAAGGVMSSEYLLRMIDHLEIIETLPEGWQSGIMI